MVLFFSEVQKTQSRIKKYFLLNVIKKGFKFRQTWQKFISFGLKILGRTCCVEHFLNRFASALMLRWDSQTCPTKLFNKKNTSVDICVSIYNYQALNYCKYQSGFSFDFSFDVWLD